ncbi:exonuclease 3'-5' domain-containing protein 2-like [Aedes aegypti]|uniref:Uncharacterized protein n=1 Tax=Aedes aegypti TaxID=7159 RepID=A0A6I8U189_AEDAE|nr:exonuclease 3'-5' domain-containing protein 2-like [Aedes aegypti]
MIVLIVFGSVLLLIVGAFFSQPEPTYNSPPAPTVQKVRSTPASSTPSINQKRLTPALSVTSKPTNPLKNPFQVMNHSVHIITTASKYTELIRQMSYACRSYPVIGLDCEWVTIYGQRQKVALLQLAFKYGICLLIRLFQMDSFPTELRELLANPQIFKVGIEVYYDGQKLLQDYGMEVKGTVDLRHLAKRLRTPGAFGLAGLAQTVLGIQLDKDKRISISDWQSFELSPVQREYAAKDAIVALDLFERFSQDIPISEMYQYVDRPFKTRFNR